MRFRDLGGLDRRRRGGEGDQVICFRQGMCSDLNGIDAGWVYALCWSLEGCCLGRAGEWGLRMLNMRKIRVMVYERGREGPGS